MINCGGRMPLFDMIKDFENTKLKIILMDSHRPLHHTNINNTNKRIIVVDDDLIDK